MKSNEINLASHLIKIKDTLKSLPDFEDFTFTSISVDSNGSHMDFFLPRGNKLAEHSSLYCKLRIFPCRAVLTGDIDMEWFMVVETMACKYNEYDIFEARNNDIKLIRFSEPDIRLSVQTIQRSLLCVRNDNPDTRLLDRVEGFLTTDPDTFGKEKNDEH